MDTEYKLNEQLLRRISTTVETIKTDLSRLDSNSDGTITSEEFTNVLNNVINTLSSFYTEVSDADESPIVTGTGLSFKGIKQGSTTLDLSKIEATLQKKSWVGHKHDANAIATGILPIARGGTGSNSVTKNVVFSGPASGSNSAPTWRALVAADIPNLDGSKITSGTLVRPIAAQGDISATGTISATGAISSLSNYLRKISNVNVAASGVTTSSGTTYNNITSDTEGGFRVEDSVGHAIGLFRVVAQPGGGIVGQSYAHDEWSGRSLNTGISYTANSKTNKHSYGLIGGSKLDFYRDITVIPQYLGIQFGTKEVTTTENFSDDVEFTFVTNAPTFTKAPIVICSIQSDQARSEAHAKSLAGLSAIVQSVSDTKCVIRIHNELKTKGLVITVNIIAIARADDSLKWS